MNAVSAKKRGNHASNGAGVKDNTRNDLQVIIIDAFLQ